MIQDSNRQQMVHPNWGKSWRVYLKRRYLQSRQDMKELHLILQWPGARSKDEVFPSLDPKGLEEHVTAGTLRGLCSEGHPETNSDLLLRGMTISKQISKEGKQMHSTSLSSLLPLVASGDCWEKSSMGVSHFCTSWEQNYWMSLFWTVSFQGFWYSRQSWKIKIVFLPRAKGRYVYCPL